MRIIDIEEVKANLEELIDSLKPWEWFAISVDGVPKVKVVALFPEESERFVQDTKPDVRSGSKRTLKDS